MATGRLISAGIASAQPAPATPAAPAASSAPSAAMPAAASGRIAPPPAGKGQVVFFRPSKFVGMALSYSVHEGDTGIGKLGNGSYFVLVGDPGPHTFSIQFGIPPSSRHAAKSEAGGDFQYVQPTLGVGIMAARPEPVLGLATFDARTGKPAAPRFGDDAATDTFGPSHG